jgi:hypothetical protein
LPDGPERYSERVLEEATATINDEGLDARTRLFRLRRLLTKSFRPHGCW